MNPTRFRLWKIAGGLVLVVVAVLIASLGMRSQRSRALRVRDTRDVAKRTAGLESSASTLSASGARARDDEPPKSTRPQGVDASNFYKDAFVLYAALSPEEKKMLRDWRGPFVSEEATALFEKIQPIMELMRKAAAADYCDWAIAADGFDTPQPQVFKGNELAALALWEANQRFASDPAGALDDLSARAQLGHHLADNLIGGLVQLGADAGAIDLLRLHASEMADAIAEKATAFLRSNLADNDVVRAFAGEAELALTIEKKLLALTPAERSEMFAESGDSNPAFDQFRTDGAALHADLEYAVSVEKQFAEAVRSWSPARYNAWWQQVIQNAANQPWTSSLISTLPGIHERYQLIRVQRDMAIVGLNVLSEGPTDLANTRDSVTGEPITYTETAGGFELRSAFEKNGKPVTMVFPLPSPTPTAGP